MDQKNHQQPPTPEQLREWVHKDLQSSHYFLGVLLRHPEVIDSMAAEIHAHVMAKENGAMIDHIQKKQEQEQHATH